MNSLSSPSSRVGRKREGPQFNRCVCSYVPSPEPRWTGRLHMAVASPTVVAFANFAVARHPQDHARWFLRGSCNEADRFTCVTARTIASPHQHGTFTVELSPGGSPQPGVDYDYAGKQPIPATGLAPARYTALWAANERHENGTMTAAIIPPPKSDQIVEASFEFQTPISFVNLAHDPKMKYVRNTACSSPRPLVSFVFFVRSP